SGREERDRGTQRCDHLQQRRKGGLHHQLRRGVRLSDGRGHWHHRLSRHLRGRRQTIGHHQQRFHAELHERRWHVLSHFGREPHHFFRQPEQLSPGDWHP